MPDAQHQSIDIVGGGLTGCVVAYLAKTLLDIPEVNIYESEGKLGGLCATMKVSGQRCYKYGGHTFHTHDASIAAFVESIGNLRHRKPQCGSIVNGHLVHWPPTMQDVNFLRSENIEKDSLPDDWIWKNYYEGYNKKMWGEDWETAGRRSAKRVNVRMDDDPYLFGNQYQGDLGDTFFYILTGKHGINVHYHTLKIKPIHPSRLCIWTAPLDLLMKTNSLPWRSVRITHETGERHLTIFNSKYQTVNLPSIHDKRLRVWDNAHFFDGSNIISTMWPEDVPVGTPIRAYPILAPDNDVVLAAKQLIQDEFPNVILAGRLGTYQYLDMDKAIANAFETIEEIKYRMQQ